jgi:membrane dipeptidase
MHELHQNALVWDAHVCFPLNPNAKLEQLQRYRASGVNFVSINIGMDMDDFEKIMQVLAGFRRYLTARPDDYVLVETAADVSAAKAAGKLAIAFDLEGSDPLLGNVNLIALYYELGVRQMLLAYNKDNQASGGCMEGAIGLTSYGKDLIAEMNRVGMIVDLSHMGHEATLDACAYSTAPVIFSHSNPNSVRKHARNISDAQIRACAATGGVIGINGIGDFLGDTTSATVVKHIEYVMNLVGPGHVGLGLDYVVDKQELIDYVTHHPDIFPPTQMQDYLAFVEPEQTAEITQLLLARGHSEVIVRGILGGNLLRVAAAVWQ